MTGTVLAVTPVPRPGSQPYRDCITSLHVTGVAGELEAAEVLVYAWGMRDDVWADAARLRPGAEVHLELVPWAEVSDRLDSFQRLEPDADEVLFLDAYWAAGLRPET